MNFKVVKPSDDFGVVVEKYEYNFNQILLHGGGPKGDKGNKGDAGGRGGTGKKGDKGDKGDKGSLIWYEGIGIATDNGLVTNVNYREGDIVIVSNGDYYLIVKTGNSLYYSYQFNFAITPLSYFLDQYNYDSLGAAVNKWHMISTGNPTEANVMLVKKITGSGFDTSNFSKLFLGLDSNPVVTNTPLVISNIIPHETSGEVFATAADFAQVAIKYRPSSRSNPTVNTVFIKYSETGGIWTCDMNNSGAKMKLVYDNSSPLNSKVILEAYSQIFNTPDNTFSKIVLTHAVGSSTITSDGDLAIGSVNPAVNQMLLNNKKIKFNFSGDTDVSAKQDAYNLNFNVNTFFKRKIKYDNIVVSIDANKSINIGNAGTRPMIYLDGSVMPTLAKIVGGDDGDVITISAQLLSIKLDIKENPGPNEIGGLIGTKVKSEFEISTTESVTLFKRTGSPSWSIISVNKRNPFDFTLYRTQDLQWSINPMEGLMKFIPGFYKIYGPNYADTSGHPFLPLSGYDETSGSILQVINSNHHVGVSYSRLFLLYRSYPESTLKNEVWMRRGQFVGGVYTYSTWEKMATNTDIANLQIDITNYIDDQINLSMANIFYKLVPNYSILPWYGPNFNDFDSTGKGISGDVVNWRLCNGVGGTPDWRGRFIVGSVTDIPSVGAPALAPEVDPNGTGNSGSGYSMGNTGGKTRHILTVPEMPAHNHPFTFGNDTGGNQHGSVWMKYDGNNNTKNTGSVGGGQAHENRPPFMATAFIMKMPTNIIPPNFCSVPTDFAIDHRTGDTYTFSFETTNAVFDSIKLKWSLNGGTDTVATILFGDLILNGSVYTFDYEVPGFSTGQYIFAMSIDCTGSNHSHYCLPIIDNVINTSDFILSFEVLAEHNPSIQIETIDLIETANNANVIHVLTVSDPIINLNSGLRQFFVPPNTYNIQIGVAGTSSPSGAVKLEYTDNTSGVDQVPYTGPSMYYFNSKNIIDNSGYVQIYDTP